MDILNLLIGVGGGLLGIIAKEGLDRLFVKAEKKIDAATQLRTELWVEIKNLRDQINEEEGRVGELEKQLTDWREKYFLMLSKYNELDVQYRIVLAKQGELHCSVQHVRAIGD